MILSSPPRLSLLGADLLERESRLPRLKRLVEAGLVEKHAYQERPVRYAYVLTDAGRGLVPVVAALGDWGSVELGGVTARTDEDGGLKPALPEASRPAPKRNEWAFGPEDSVW